MKRRICGSMRRRMVKSIEKGIQFLFPYVQDKNKWTFGKDVMYWEHWPVAHPFLVFGAQQFTNKIWFNTWKSLGS